MSTELAALRAELRREQLKVALMTDVGRALSSGLALDPLLALIMEKVTQLMQAARSTLYLLSDDGQELWSKVVQGGELVEIRLAVGEGLAGWVATTGEVVNLADAYNDARFQPAVDLRSGFRTSSILAAPMRDRGGAIVGVLQVLNKHAGPFEASDEELLVALANQAAVAIENARLYQSAVAQNEELIRARAELEALFEVERELSAATELESLLARILESVAALVGASSGQIALREGEALRVVARHGDAVALDAGGLLSWAVVHREAVIVDNPGSDPRIDAHALLRASRAVLAAPLVDGDEVLGGIELMQAAPSMDQTIGPAFDDDDLKLLVLIGGQVAKAIVLARSRNEATVRDRLAAIGQLLASILHDLKTPMTIISGYAQLMAMSDDADQRDKYAALILRQFELLSSMTREVLAFARGEVDLVVRKVYLHRFMEELETQLRAVVAGRPEGSTVDVVIHRGFDGVAHFDEAKVLRVLHNLARNAVEAMVTGGTLQVGCDLDGSDLVFTIRDNGPGIPPQVQGRMFALFASAKSGGTGLGLAIVKKIVDDHGGRIDWASGPGGTSFRIALPRERGDVLVADPAEAHDAADTLTGVS
jgi:signal transduction histidine kinase